MDGNPMIDPPIEVCCQGTSAILEYLQEKKHKKAMTLKVPVLRKQCKCTHAAAGLVIRYFVEQPTENSVQYQKHLKTLFASATVEPYF